MYYVYEILNFKITKSLIFKSILKKYDLKIQFIKKIQVI